MLNKIYFFTAINILLFRLSKKDITIFDKEIDSYEISNLNTLIIKTTDYFTQVKLWK